MIKYPFFEKNSKIGVTAPSSGVPLDLHNIFKQACRRMEDYGYKVICGDTVWTQDKATSAIAEKRAIEFNHMMKDDEIDLIIPPWGGELAIEMIDQIDYDHVKEKWILGYSDTSSILLAITLKTGMATAHGTNLLDLRGQFADDTTAMWESVLSTKKEGAITQYSSERYQKEWNHADPSPCVFHLTEETYWKTVSHKKEMIQGRLLGGCIDIIRHLIGTPYGDVQAFKEKFIPDEAVIWYLENCDLNTTDLRRSLVQMKLAGWFENCSGILFGRSSANQSVENYMIEDVYNELSEELGIPVVFDIDCGHEPPQITFINGAYAEIEVDEGKGKVIQYFK